MSSSASSKAREKVNINFVSREILVRDYMDLFEKIHRHRIGWTGCFRYDVTVEKRHLKKLEKIGFQRLYFTLSLQVTDYEAKNLIQMMRSHCERVLGKPTPNCEYTFNVVNNSETGVDGYFPIFDNEYVWVHPEETRGLYRNFDQYAGLLYVGDNPMHIVAARELNYPVLWVDDFVLAINQNRGDQRKELEDDILLKSVRAMADKKCREGYAVFDDQQHLKICEKICGDWKIETKQYDTEQMKLIEIADELKIDIVDKVIILMKSDFITGCTLKSWITHNVERATYDLPPIAIVSEIRKDSKLPHSILRDGRVSVVAETLDELIEEMV